MTPMQFQQAGTDAAQVFAEMEAAREGDVDWRRGRVGAYVHFGGEDVLEVAKGAYLRFFSENALGQKAFPSLRKFETEVVAWAADLLHAPAEAMGTLTSGGTESIFLAVKTARDRARAERPQVTQPEIVAPVSAHPAFDKAAHYLGMKVRRVPITAQFRADVDAMKAAIGPDTVMIIGSAPAFPHGVFDPIADIAALAREHQLWMHVDACVGGFLAPFAARLGYPIPAFDFALDGVCSMSADLHKYGFTAKGASVVLFASEAWRPYLVFEFDNWPRGKYSAPTFGGSRPGGAIAAAWAVMRYLGVDGYVRIAKQIMAARDRMIEGIGAIDGLYLVGKPELAVLSYSSRELDMFAVAEQLGRKGWFVSPMSEPPGIHLGMLTLAHVPIVDEYLGDLAAAVDLVRSGKLTAGSRDVSYGG